MPVSPPRIKGPHLNALRAFESAARLGSFTAAAEELSVTPGAIAQHIKTLEAWAESSLFERRSRGVELTPLGEELLPEFTAAFDQLGEAVHALRTKATPQKIRIATLPSIAQLWLSERLEALRQLAPHLSVSVIAIEQKPNLSREPFDVALFFEDMPIREGGVSLLQDSIFPVCSPEIGDRLNSLDDLNNETLLRDSTWIDDWNRWLSVVFENEKILPNGPAYSLFSVALEEARRGAGILIAHEALVTSALDSGDLVAPFEDKVTTDRYLVMRTSSSFSNHESCELMKSIFSESSEQTNDSK